jgi:hypothetical protein
MPAINEGMFLRMFGNRSSRRARFTVGAGALALTLTGLATASTASTAGAAVLPHKGPVYPAPGSGTETTTGDSGQTGGATYTFTGVKTRKTKMLVWGLWYPKYPATWSFGLDTATLAYDSVDSNLPSGEAVYSGSAEFPNVNGTTPTLPIRLVVQAGGGLAMEASKAAHLGINSAVGAVLHVKGNFSVNLTFEVSPDGGTTWDPADIYYNNTPHVAGSTSSSVSGAFWYEPL